MNTSIVGVLSSGTAIVVLVTALKWIGNLGGWRLTKGALRWIVYVLAVASAFIVAAIDSHISVADPVPFFATIASTLTVAEALYRTVAGKLNLKDGK